MNPLKEHAHLFANGEFQVQHPDGVWTLTGKDADVIIEAPEKGGWPEWTQQCTLIARPIEDMTDEERNQWRKECKKSNDHAMLYALSIGCLPKIFEHCFDDGTVIDSTTL